MLDGHDDRAGRLPGFEVENQKVTETTFERDAAESRARNEARFRS